MLRILKNEGALKIKRAVQAGCKLKMTFEQRTGLLEQIEQVLLIVNHSYFIRVVLKLASTSSYIIRLKMIDKTGIWWLGGGRLGFGDVGINAHYKFLEAPNPQRQPQPPIPNPCYTRTCMTDVSTFITAGGPSSRMGTDKAWLEIDGRPMIEHVIAALVPLTNRLAIIANHTEYERLGYPVYRDTNVGIGPIEALRTALSNAPTPRVILVACDLPLVTTELFRFLLEASEEHYATVPVGPDGKLEPLCAVYHREALSAVNDLIEEGQRKIGLVFDRVPTRVIAFDELAHLSESDLFFENINSPEDYSKIRSLNPRKSL